MKHRRLGLLASTVLAVSILATACGGGSSSESAAASASSSAAAAKVVTHVMEPDVEDPRTVIRSGPPVTGEIPEGTPISGGKHHTVPFDGVPKVGPVFFSVDDMVSVHYCTASVVHSGSGDLIVTAAHCVYNKMFGGWQDHIVFAPGYHDGIAPYGLWVATTAYLNSTWVSRFNQDVDIAFLKVRKLGGGTQTLESLTGADTFTVSPGYQNTVSVAAYPLTKSKPIGCSGSTKKYRTTQMEMDCAGLPDGSSGSPFIASGNRLVGVLGGFEQGGNTADTSFSIYFTERIAKIYRATAG